MLAVEEPGGRFLLARSHAEVLQFNSTVTSLLTKEKVVVCY